MARKNGPITAEEEIEAAGPEEVEYRRFDDSPLDARVLDLEDERESPFLRGQKRVPVRRGALPRKTADRVKLVLILILLIGLVALIWLTLYRYGTQSWRFRLDSSDDIEIVGNRNVTRAQVLEVFASDIDRNIFFVPIAERKRQLESTAWIQSATIMRLLPNRLKVIVQERTPVAFADVGGRIELIDSSGVIMEPPVNPESKYSFPVLLGMSESEPLSTRVARMKIYSELVKQLDSGDAHYSRDLSDIDLSDPDDVKATVVDPQGAVLVHLGSSEFLPRFKIYMGHVREWRAQFLNLRSVDLRYDHQVIVNPDSADTQPQTATPKPLAAKNAGSTESEIQAKHKKSRKH
jgi:cell division protein FtsQ